MNPTKIQEEFLSGCAGTNRYTWNWILDKFKSNSKENKFNLLELRKSFNKTKLNDTPWIYDYPKDCNQNAFRDFQTTLSRLKNKTSKFPKFKSKHDGKQGFYISNDKFRVRNGKLELSKKIHISLSENLRFDAKINGLRVVKENNKWYACFSFDGDFSRVRKSNGVIGLDLGIKTFSFDSNNSEYNYPKKLKKIERRIRRRQRQLSKSKKGSNNRAKKKIKLNNTYETLKNIRKDFLHKLSNIICSENQTIKMEDLNVNGMIKNKNLARSIQNSCWNMFYRMVEYKSKLYGNEFVIVDRFYPSSKTCSNCGNKKDDLKLSDRVYNCSCGLSINRDLNAALNIKNYLPLANGEYMPVDCSKNGTKQEVLIHT